MIKERTLNSILAVTSKKHECCLQFWINIYVLLDWFDTIFLWCFGKNSRSANNASFAIIKLPEILRLSQSLYNKVLFIQHNLKFRLQSLWISVIYRTDGTSSFKFLKQTLINFQFFEVGTMCQPKCVCCVQIWLCIAIIGFLLIWEIRVCFKPQKNFWIFFQLSPEFFSGL